MDCVLFCCLVDSLVGGCEQILRWSLLEDFYGLLHGFLARVINRFLARVLPEGFFG